MPVGKPCCLAAFVELSRQVGFAKDLSELGRSEGDRDALIQDALSDLIIPTTSRYPTHDEVRELDSVAMRALG